MYLRSVSKSCRGRWRAWCSRCARNGECHNHAHNERLVCCDRVHERKITEEVSQIAAQAVLVFGRRGCGGAGVRGCGGAGVRGCRGAGVRGCGGARGGGAVQGAGREGRGSGSAASCGGGEEPNRARPSLIQSHSLRFRFEFSSESSTGLGHFFTTTCLCSFSSRNLSSVPSLPLCKIHGMN
jgi:hypothetical protein